MRVIVVLENEVEADREGDMEGQALGRTIEILPALQGLVEFVCIDPRTVAVAVGMTYALDPDDIEDLDEVDLGPMEWFEPAAGLAAVHAAAQAVRDDPESTRRMIYDPALRAADVIAELEHLEQVLRAAQDQERRFHLLMRP